MLLLRAAARLPNSSITITSLIGPEARHIHWRYSLILHILPANNFKSDCAGSSGSIEGLGWHRQAGAAAQCWCVDYVCVIWMRMMAMMMMAIV